MITMPLHIKEFVIQAKFEGEDEKQSNKSTSVDLASLNEDIISDCMEKLGGYLRKEEGR